MRSNVNQSTFIQYIYLDVNEMSDEMVALLDDRRDIDSLSKAWIEQFKANPLLFFHETYHYWQGLRLPFLYRFGVLSHRVLWEAYSAMAARDRPLHQWDIMLPELYRLTLGNSVAWFEDGKMGHFVVGPSGARHEGATATWELTPQGMLETAASLAEFQVSTVSSARQEAKAFSRWCKRHAVYRDAYDIVSIVLGEELALVAVVPLVNGAMETSDPIRAMIALLALLNGMRVSGQLEGFLAYPEPRQWVNLVGILLDDMEFESSAEDRLLVGSPFHRIRLENWLGATYGDTSDTVEHPFLTARAHEWARRALDDPGYRWLLGQPGWVPDEVFWSAVLDLAPPLSFVRIEGGPETAVISVGDTGFNSAELTRLLTVYSTVLRASEVGFDPENRLCYHKACPEFAHNFCNTYPVIPVEYGDCRFLEIQEEARVEMASRRSAK